MKFRDRAEAGRRLAAELAGYAGEPDVLVLALPRGGVPVAFEVARALHAPLDVFVVRKLGVPGHEELAMGAIATGGVRVLNEPVVDMLRVPEPVIDGVAEAERRELERREHVYRGDRPLPRVRDRMVILVDDGLATGSTMRAAVAALRQQNPSRIVVAVPVAAPETCRDFEREADEIVCALTPEPFYAVGLWYDDFSQTTDTEVHELLDRAGFEAPADVSAPPAPPAGGNYPNPEEGETAMASERDRNDASGQNAAARDSNNESGLPGGGVGRQDEVGGSGVYPASAQDAPKGADIRTPAAWGQGERGAAGYEDSGRSELSVSDAELRAAEQNSASDEGAGNARNAQPGANPQSGTRTTDRE